MTKTAFIGLGNMGAPMARNVAKAGYELVMFDLRHDVAQALGNELGAEISNSLQEAANGVDRVITMVANGDVVADILFGDDGLAANLKPGTIVIDMSSSYPTKTQETGAKLKELGIVMLDAPVSGGVARATSGDLAIMLGGDENSAIEVAAPMLESMGTVFKTGPLGSGHALKALNNYLSAIGLTAAAEALIVGEKFGLDRSVMIDVINSSTGRNTSTERKFHGMILEGKFNSGFALDLMAKDLRAATQLADELDVGTDILNLTTEMWTAAEDELGQGADHTEIYKIVEGKRK